jgi:hypothetical protein
MTSGTVVMKDKTALRYLTAILILWAWSGLTFAASMTISAIIPWQGQGKIYPIGTDRLRFLGDIEGIMYVETAEGALNEAFVQCPIVQDIDVTGETTTATGNCTIVVSTDDAVFAELTCSGMRGYCSGEFKLTGGTGRFSGISGSSRMTVRSPVHALARDLSDGTVLQIAAGILQLPELTITLPQ